MINLALVDTFVILVKYLTIAFSRKTRLVNNQSLKADLEVHEIPVASYI